MFAIIQHGALLFHVNYRNPNFIMSYDSNILTRTNEWIVSRNEAEWFSIQDANLGYWKIEIGKRAREKTVLATHHGRYRFIGIPFGLESAVLTFETGMRLIPTFMP